LTSSPNPALMQTSGGFARDMEETVPDGLEGKEFAKFRSRPHLESCSTAAPSPRGSYLHGGRLSTFSERRPHLYSDDFDDDMGLLETPVCAERDVTPPRSQRQARPTIVPRTPSPPRRLRSCSPPGAPRRAPFPPLMRALRTLAPDTVRVVLHDDPEAASLPFFDHAMETPLCCAVRFGCCAQVLRLLLEYGAGVDDADMEGRTPLAILCSAPPTPTWQEQFVHFDGELSLAGRCVQRTMEAAHVLLEAGANPLMQDGSGRCALVRACEIGNEDLLQLFCERGLAEEVNRARVATGFLTGGPRRQQPPRLRQRPGSQGGRLPRHGQLRGPTRSWRWMTRTFRGLLACHLLYPCLATRAPGSSLATSRSMPLHVPVVGRGGT